MLAELRRACVVLENFSHSAGLPFLMFLHCSSTTTTTTTTVLTITWPAWIVEFTATLRRIWTAFSMALSLALSLCPTRLQPVNVSWYVCTLRCSHRKWRKSCCGGLSIPVMYNTYKKSRSTPPTSITTTTIHRKCTHLPSTQNTVNFATFLKAPQGPFPLVTFDTNVDRCKLLELILSHTKKNRSISTLPSTFRYIQEKRIFGVEM